MPSELKTKLEKMAAESGRSLNAEIVHLLQEGVAAHEAAPAGPLWMKTYPPGERQWTIFSEQPAPFSAPGVIYCQPGAGKTATMLQVLREAAENRAQEEFQKGVEAFQRSQRSYAEVDKTLAGELAERMADPANREHLELLASALVKVLDPHARHGVEKPEKESDRKTENATPVIFHQTISRGRREVPSTPKRKVKETEK